MMAFCKHRVMDKCGKDNRPCIFSEDCFEPEERKPLTNADRIRAMSDEELAETLNSSVCPPHNKCNTRQHCLKCWIDWLKQPTED